MLLVKAQQSLENMGPRPSLTKWIHTAIVCPKISYACHLWIHHLEKTTASKNN